MTAQDRGPRAAEERQPQALPQAFRSTSEIPQGSIQSVVRGLSQNGYRVRITNLPASFANHPRRSLR